MKTKPKKPTYTIEQTTRTITQEIVKITIPICRELVAPAGIRKPWPHHRAERWNNDSNGGALGPARPSLKKCYEAAKMLEPNSKITFSYKLDEWEKITKVCNRLRIEPIAWLTAWIALDAALSGRVDLGLDPASLQEGQIFSMAAAKNKAPQLFE